MIKRLWHENSSLIGDWDYILFLQQFGDAYFRPAFFCTEKFKNELGSLIGDWKIAKTIHWFLSIFPLKNKVV